MSRLPESCASVVQGASKPLSWRSQVIHQEIHPGRILCYSKKIKVAELDNKVPLRLVSPSLAGLSSGIVILSGSRGCLSLDSGGTRGTIRNPSTRLTGGTFETFSEACSLKSEVVGNAARMWLLVGVLHRISAGSEYQ